MRATEFRELVSGRRRGVAAIAARGLLRVAEIPYGLVVQARNRKYDRGGAAVHRVSVPVVSVGNLTVGGTGKTPVVAWLARWFRSRQKRVTLISRGYRAEAGAQNDEALELERQLPDVPHVQDGDRVAAAAMAIEEFEAEVLLLDDAFQHRRIHRDLDIVLIDALEPFGYGHLLPRGLLREPIRSLQRADVVALSRADLVDAQQRTHLWAQMRRHLRAEAVCVELCHQPQACVNWSGEHIAVSAWQGKRLGAFCGLGNPAGFERTLRGCQLNIAGWRTFEDHHAYQRTDIDALRAWAEQEGFEGLLCTGKDLVKLQLDRLGRVPLRALEIEVRFLRGQEDLERRLAELIDAADSSQSG